jgi:UDP-2-acetamido-3-amino-2,3-dideoxy-glucuronate N-acetyltransferase
MAISTPAATHYEIVKQSLLAGKDVFLEKPLALTMQEGKKLVTLAAKEERILMVGHILQYHPAVDGKAKAYQVKQVRGIIFKYKLHERG